MSDLGFCSGLTRVESSARQIRTAISCSEDYKSVFYAFPSPTSDLYAIIVLLYVHMNFIPLQKLACSGKLCPVSMCPSHFLNSGRFSYDPKSWSSRGAYVQWLMVHLKICPLTYIGYFYMDIFSWLPDTWAHGLPLLIVSDFKELPCEWISPLLGTALSVEDAGEWAAWERSRGTVCAA